MFVACPHCGFLVAAQSAATLRCPRCGSAIDPRLAKPLQGDHASSADSADVAADTTPAATAPDIAPGTNATPDRTPTDSAPATKARRMRHAPSFVRRHAPAPVHSRDRRGGWIAAALMLLLIAQIVLAQRNELAANARWRPLVNGLCNVLRCEVPAWREPAAFTMLQRSVQPRPDAPGVLHVNASFRNDARWMQPWPTVVLTLSDMEGREVGMRAFTPAEYGAGNSNDQYTAGIGPGQSTTIQLDVIEPAQQVVAFTFDFN